MLCFIWRLLTFSIFYFQMFLSRDLKTQFPTQIKTHFLNYFKQLFLFLFLFIFIFLLFFILFSFYSNRATAKRYSDRAHGHISRLELLRVRHVGVLRIWRARGARRYILVVIQAKEASDGLSHVVQVLDAEV